MMANADKVAAEANAAAIAEDVGIGAEEAFASIDGLSDFPEMVVLLKQVEAYRGRGASARLFYRSKVEEAVALVVDKSFSRTTDVFRPSVAP